MKQTSTKVCFVLALFSLLMSNSLIAQTTPGEVRISVISSLTQEICTGDVPNPFLETIAPTSSVPNATFEFQWMLSFDNTTPGSAGWVNITGATSKDYTPPALGVPTYFSRCARVAGSNDNFVESNAIFIDIESPPGIPSFTVNSGGMVYQNQPTVFNGNNMPNVTYEWDFDMDGNVDCIGQNCFNVYNTPGMTQTMLMVVSNTGLNCMSSVTNSFMVESVLPVELTSFEGKEDENSNILLQWSTASESNSSHYVIEKSSEGSRFEEIGIIESYGDGNSNSPQSYSFIDENPSNGLNYYRLKQIDFDGNYEYFKIISVRLEDNLNGTFVFPNPARYKLNVQTDLEINNGATIEIVDTYGQIVHQSIVSSNGLNNFEIGIEDLKGGVYFLNIISTNKTELFSQKFIIIN